MKDPFIPCIAASLCTPPQNVGTAKLGKEAISALFQAPLFHNVASKRILEKSASTVPKFPEMFTCVLFCDYEKSGPLAELFSSTSAGLQLPPHLPLRQHGCHIGSGDKNGGWCEQRRRNTDIMNFVMSGENVPLVKFLIMDF